MPVPTRPPVASKPSPQKPSRRSALDWAIIAFVLVCFGGIAVVVAKVLLAVPIGQQFIAAFPGETDLPAGTPVGVPAWLGWQHFLNAFFIVLIIKTGWQVRTQQRPPATWVRDNTKFPRTANPPRRISLTLWTHLSLDALWLINGVVFVVLLFATGLWARVVPTTWEVLPNALSAALQYLSLDWPTENGWVNYNSLQLLTYFVTIFIAAPAAALTGLRMSAAWPQRATRLNRLYPIELARAIHFPVMLYFVLFVITHVALVLATGALRNLNHMYAGKDASDWIGALIFGASLVAMAGAWVALRPVVVRPIAALTGKVSR